MAVVVDLIDSGENSLTGKGGKGLEGDGTGSGLARSHISQRMDGVWLAYVQN